MFYALAGLAFLATQLAAHPLAASPQGIQHQNAAAAFRPTTSSKYFSSSQMKKLGMKNIGAKSGNYLDIATKFAKKVNPKATFRVVKDHYVGQAGVAHVYLKQTVNGADIINADMNINVAKDGSILSYGTSFVKKNLPASSLTSANLAKPVDALKSAAGTLRLGFDTNTVSVEPKGQDSFVVKGAEGTNAAPTVKLVYYHTPEGDVKPVWSVSTDLWDNWYETYVDAENGDSIVAAINYAFDAKYQVYPWGVMDPTVGERQIVTDPWDTTASEFTWQGDGSKTYTESRGNNAVAIANWDSGSDYENDPKAKSATSEFVFPYDITATDFKSYGNASVTQVFYTVNKYHDVLYKLGFNEAAGNFEYNNAGAGGKGNDFVIACAQDGSGTNNANFLTPPDGQPGRMRMYMWDRSTPKRDGAFDAAIVIHEATHGLSNRLTGGPDNTRCLQSLESGGMGEGWSDAFANAVRISTKDTRDTDIVLGAWVFNNPKGIRQQPYSTNMQRDTWTYGAIGSQGEVHDVGEIWASVLYDLLWNLVDQYKLDDSISPTLDSRGVATNGRYLFMQLVKNGMALQPCSPTFVSARDAIIDADKALTGGKNLCLLWKTFARRGVGAAASSSSRLGRLTVKEDFALPTGVC